MPQTRPPYPPEFRAEAVRLAKSSGDSIRQVSKDLGISDQTLRNWVRALGSPLQPSGGSPVGGSRGTLNTELTREQELGPGTEPCFVAAPAYL